MKPSTITLQDIHITRREIVIAYRDSDSPERERQVIIHLADDYAMHKAVHELRQLILQRVSDDVLEQHIDDMRLE